VTATDYVHTLQTELDLQRLQNRAGRERVAELEARIRLLERQAQVREELLEDLEDLVATDALTGVHSRRWAVDALEGAGDVILVDLDRFKAINDTYGHGVGDAVLVEVACRLDGIAPDLVARIGGDEFVIIVPAGAPLHADAIATAVAIAIGDTPVQLGHGVEVDVCASVGVAQVLDGDVQEEVLHRADVAMYHHKHGGCGWPVRWLPDMEAPTAPAPVRRSHRDMPEVAA
jgi:two-component system cell cycle response regulator